MNFKQSKSQDTFEICYSFSAPTDPNISISLWLSTVDITLLKLPDRLVVCGGQQGDFRDDWLDTDADIAPTKPTDELLLDVFKTRGISSVTSGTDIIKPGVANTLNIKNGKIWGDREKRKVDSMSFLQCTQRWNRFLHWSHLLQRCPADVSCSPCVPLLPYECPKQ